MTFSKTHIAIAGTAIVIAVAGFLYARYVQAPQTAAADRDIKLFIAGDVMLDRGIQHYATLGGANQFIFEKITPVLKQHDLNLVNLEGPITDNASVSRGSAVGSVRNYIFTFDPSWAQTLAENNIRLVNLGNNHILNFGREGLRQTKAYLEKAGVSYFGAPDYPRSIAREIRGVKIEFVNYNQFSELDSATEEQQAVENIQAATQRADVVIVMPHWGEEYQFDPTPEQQRIGRRFIDAGADLVIGSHSHTIGRMEEYQGKRIYYSLGNFIFDQYFQDDVREGLGVTVLINPKTKGLSFVERRFYLDHSGQTIPK